MSCCWLCKRIANPMSGTGNTSQGMAKEHRMASYDSTWDVITHAYCDLVLDLDPEFPEHSCLLCYTPPSANWPCSRAQRKRDGCEEASAPGSKGWAALQLLWWYWWYPSRHPWYPGLHAGVSGYSLSSELSWELSFTVCLIFFWMFEVIRTLSLTKT